MLHLQTRSLLPFLLIAAVSGTACLVDDDVPATPILDELRGRTSLTSLEVAGVAEFNATVTITGGAETASTVADGRTGRFAVDVPLSQGENALVAIATDAVGNASDAATATVVQEPARAEVVRVTLPRTVISADDGTLEVIVDISNDEAEIDLATLGVTLTIPEDASFTALPVAVNDTGHAVVVLPGLRVAGTFTLRVEADVADLDGAKAFDQAGFTVVPGRPGTVEVGLSATVDGVLLGPSVALTVPADTPVNVDVTVKDAFNNLVLGAPIRIDAPGSGGTVLGDVVVGLTRAGAYEVVADTGSGLVAGTADLTIIAAAPDHLELTVDATLVQAGTAVTAIARVVDAFGNTVTDAVPDLDINAPQVFAAPSIVAGIATATVTVTLAGSWTITASDPASAATAEAAGLQVVAAEPVNGNFVEIDPAGLPYQAGDPVFVNYELVDAFGNVNSATPIVVTVNAPNVSVTDNGAGTIEVNGIVRAGSYIVRARAIGTGLPDDLETLVVGPNPELAGFNLVLSAGLVAEFGTIIFNGTDGFGNTIAENTITTTFSDATAISRAGSQLTFNRPGTFSVTACITGTTLCDTEFISVQGLLDTVPPSVTVTIETPIGITEVVRNQRIVFRVDVTDDRALSELRFVATFGDNGACVRTGGPVLFSATTSESRTFSFSVPNCAIPLDAVSIVAQATDEAGNTRNGANDTLTITDPFQLTFPNNGGQFSATVAAFEDRIDVPHGLAVDQLSGTFYVASNGNDRAVGVPIDRVQFELRDQGNNRINLLNVQGAAASIAGNLFFGVDDVNNGINTAGIIRVRPDLVSERFVDNAQPGGQAEAILTQRVVPQLALDESAGMTPAVCMVITSQDHIYCYGNLDAQPAAPSRLAEIDINGLRPRGIAIDPANDPGVAGDTADVLYVALNRAVGVNRVVRRLTFNGTRTTLSVGTDILLPGNIGIGDDDLADLAVGPAPERNLYLADRGNGRVLKIVPGTGVVTVFLDNLATPTGLSFDGQSLLVSDDSDRVVFRVIPIAGSRF